MTDPAQASPATPAPGASDASAAAPTGVLTVLTTTDDTAAAGELARGAVEARLAACAQIAGPVTSVYRWEGAVTTSQEWQVLFKTTTERYPALEAWLLREHPYDTPEVIAAPVVRGSGAYLEWVAGETSA